MKIYRKSVLKQKYAANILTNICMCTWWMIKYKNKDFILFSEKWTKKMLNLLRINEF
jgi:hypothetical protein